MANFLIPNNRVRVGPSYIDTDNYSITERKHSMNAEKPRKRQD